MGLFGMDEMVLSPDLEGEVTAYVLERCKDLGAVDRVRVFRKSAAGVATVRFRLPEAAAACVARFSATVMLTRLFTRAALLADVALPRAIVRDVTAKCAQLGVARAAELTVEGAARCPVWPLKGSSAGRVALACASRDAAEAAAQGLNGVERGEAVIEAALVRTQMWGAHPRMNNGNAVLSAALCLATARRRAAIAPVVACAPGMDAHVQCYADGVTPPSAYGKAENEGDDDARLEAFEEELAAR